MLGRLQWSVLALAQPADIQLSLFPDFVCKADELALNFEQGLGLVEAEDEVTERQRAALDALDKLISAMSGQHNAEFWTDEAVRSDAMWENIRAMAKGVAQAFDWPLQAPPPSDDIYIPASG